MKSQRRILSNFLIILKHSLLSFFIFRIKKQYCVFLQVFIIHLCIICSIGHYVFAQHDTVDSNASEAFIFDDESQDRDVIVDSNDEVIQAKILNLETITNLDDLLNQTLYVGQYITIQYRLILFNDAKIIYTEFKPSLEQKTKQNKLSSVSLVKDGEWQKDGDSYIASYTFKILNTKVSIPALVVHVQNDVMQDAMQTDVINLVAQSLSNSPNYCGVIANDLKVVEYTLEHYDDNTNMILIEIEGHNSNLEDFRLPNIKDQEFGQGTKFSNETARVNVLARIPKSIATIDFSYFDINKRNFIPLSIPNVINVSFDDEVKADLNPKSSYLRITNIAIIVLIVWFLLLTIIKRSYFAAVISCFLVGLLVYRIFANSYSIKTLPNARDLIQPTRNATELLVIPNPTKLEAIDKKNDFYKVHIDSKVGWISRMDTNKK